MAGVPSNLIPTKITQLQDAPVASEDSLMMIVYQGNNYKIRVGDLLSVAGVPTSRQVIAGTGLQGGGQLSSNVTLSIAPGGVGSTELSDTGVAAGVYGDAQTIPVFTVDETGRVTAATQVPAVLSGYVPTTTQVIAGDGLQGGGQLGSNVELSANFSETTPLSNSGSGSAGSSVQVSRGDHTHPAVDLSSSSEIDGVLGLGSGGTGRSLVASAGSIIWCGVDGLYVGPQGLAGQALISGGSSSYSWADIVVASPEPANTVYAGPTTGSNANPTFRALVNADLPNTIDGRTFTNVDINSGTIDNTAIGGSTPAAGTFSTLTTSSADINGGSIDGTVIGANVAAAASFTNAYAERIDLDTTPPAQTDQEGRMYWDSQDNTKTLNIGMAGGAVVQQVGQELFYRVKAQGAISNGDVVMFVDTLGASVGIVASKASGIPFNQPELVMGIATENIANNAWGYVTCFGKVRGVNTTGGAEAWTDGTVLYYNPAVSGGLTKNKPEAPNPIVIVAVVLHAATNGVLLVRPTFGSVLGGSDGNVQFSTLSNGDVIVYDGVQQRWENAAQSSLSVGSATSAGTATSATTSTNISGGAANRIPYQTGAGATSFIAAPTISSTVLTWNGSAFTWSASSGGSGTVTSVDVSGGTTGLTFSGGPVTVSGTITASGTLSLTNGGTGQTTAQAAINALAGAVTSGQYLRGDGSNVVMSSIQAADVPTLNQNTTGQAGSAVNVVGGAASQLLYQSAANTTSFLANGTSGQVLKSNGSSAPSWGGVDGGTF